jgi:hypothetical protein
MDASHLANNLDVVKALWALGGASVVAVVAQLIKKYFKLSSTKVIQFLVVSLGFAVSALQYLLGAHNLPATVLGLHTVALVGVAQPLYVYIIKPLDSFFTKVQNYNSGTTTGTTAQSSTVPTSTVTYTTPSLGATPTNFEETPPTQANF